MTTGGWLFLGLSLAFVWGLAIYCYSRVLTAPRGEQRADPEDGRSQG